jgi:hypothetical protein
MGIKLQSRRMDLQTDLNKKRELTERLVDHMNDLSQVCCHLWPRRCRSANQMVSFMRTRTIAPRAKTYSARSFRHQARAWSLPDRRTCTQKTLATQTSRKHQPWRRKIPLRQQSRFPLRQQQLPHLLIREAGPQNPSMHQVQAPR